MFRKNPEETVVLDHIVVIAQAKPDYKPTVFYHVPAPGDAVPDFKLRNQDGRAIHLGSVPRQGAAADIYLHALPAAQFLPADYAQLCRDRSPVGREPGALCKTHLLCISFDPEHDTPARLRAYGAEYIGSDAKNAFAHWDFAVPRSRNC